VNSYLADWLYDRLRVVSYAFAGRSSVAFGAGDGNSNPYRQPELLRRHLSDIRRFVEAGSRQGAVVTIVPFDPDVKIAGTLAGRYQHFVEALRREGIPFLDAADALHPYEYRELILSPRDPHPSALANQAMAEQVAQRLVESGSSVVASPTRVGRESNGASAAQPRTLR